MTVWQLSVRALPVILAIVMVRALALHRIPKRTFLVLWGLALFALLIPVQLHLPLPSISLPLNELEAPMAYNFPVASRDVVITGPGPAISDGNNLPAVADAELSAIPWALIIWMIAAGGMAVYFVGNHIRYRLRYRFAVPCEDETVREWLRQNAPRRRSVKIKVSTDISTALTYGVFRPVILLPQATDWKDRRQVEYVLLHEMTHIRHFDTIWKWCLCAALCVHWFNPLVWVMFVLANRDLELICDESVLKTIGVSSRSEYALTLIGLAEQQIKITQFGMAFSKNAIEERILAIMKTKKVSWLATALAVVLIVGVTTGFTAAGQAAADHSPEKVNNAPPAGSQQDNPAKASTEAQHYYSYVDRDDGKTYYTTDEGMTWLEGDLFAATGYGFDEIEWWTAEEYEAWLEEQKKEFQAVIGERGWTPSTGWFTWDQKMVDEAIAGNEQLLEEIRSGKKVSKPTVDGDAMVIFGYDPRAIETATESGSALDFSQQSRQEVTTVGGNLGDGDTVESGYAVESGDTGPGFWEDFAKYAPFGVTFVKSGSFGNIYWNGELVHVLEDHAPDGKYQTICSSDEGGINIQTVYDSNGKLVGVEPVKE